MEIEPYPIEKGQEYWEEGCPQWLERYEYIESRSEAWLDNFREDYEYDFTRTLGAVSSQQKAVLLSYQRFAKGELTVLGVANQVKILRDAFRRKEATPLTPEEIEEQKPKKPEYVPQWRKDWEAKLAERKKAEHEAMILEQPSPDKDKIITERAYRWIEGLDASPMPGLNCYCIDADEGYLGDGTKTTRALAYLQVLWDYWEAVYPDKVKRPANLTGEKIETPGEGSTEQETVETIKERIAEKERAERLQKLDKRLKRSRKAT